MKSVLFVFLLLVFSGSLHAAPGTADPKNPDTRLEQRLAKIDTVFSQLQYKQTERLIKMSLLEYPKNADLLWRYANLMINIGDVAKAEKKKPYYRRSVEYAEAAVKSDPKNASAHAFIAASYGSIGMFAGGEEKVKLAYRIRDALNKSLKLDPNNFYAHTIYGTYHREVAEISWLEKQLANLFLGGLPDGSYKQAIRHFKKAAKIAPNVLRNRFELGLTYDSMGEEKLAIKAFKRALRCPPTLKADKGRIKFMRVYIADNS
jgi:tetratricopeptide (TPR) repeat protein